MTDSEKLALIDTMIADFWEYCPDEQQAAGAMVFVNAISTVVNFEENPNE